MPEMPRGDIPQRVDGVLAAAVGFAWAAGPWLSGDLHAPKAQVHELAERAKSLEEAAAAVLEECRRVYRLVDAYYGTERE